MGLDFVWQHVPGHLAELVSAHHAKVWFVPVKKIWCTHDLHLLDSAFLDFANRCIWRISGKTGAKVWIEDMNTIPFCLKIMGA